MSFTDGSLMSFFSLTVSLFPPIQCSSTAPTGVFVKVFEENNRPKTQNAQYDHKQDLPRTNYHNDKWQHILYGASFVQLQRLCLKLQPTKHQHMDLLITKKTLVQNESRWFIHDSSMIIHKCIDLLLHNYSTIGIFTFFFFVVTSFFCPCRKQNTTNRAKRKCFFFSLTTCLKMWRKFKAHVRDQFWMVVNVLGHITVVHTRQFSISAASIIKKKKSHNNNRTCLRFSGKKTSNIQVLKK